MARSADRRRRTGRHRPALITSAPHSPEEDLNRRQMEYLAMMSLRVACFIAAVFLHGVWRWIAVAGAAFLPAIAVVIANAVDLRLNKGQDLPDVPPEEPQRPELEGPDRTTPLIIPGESEPLRGNGTPPPTSGEPQPGRPEAAGTEDDPESAGPEDTAPGADGPAG